MGGTLRDLAADHVHARHRLRVDRAVAYFFHCSSSSRGMLPLGAIDAGLYDEADVPVVRAFAEKVLTLMGTEGKWIGNFASRGGQGVERQRRHPDQATKTEGGWLLNGVKSFGCLTGTADYYLVTARRADLEGLDVAVPVPRRPPRAEGVRARIDWNGLGMRASGNYGIILEDCFVADDMSLTVPGAFMTSTKVARGSWVGNQVAIGAIYAGIARGAYEYALEPRDDADVRRHRQADREPRPCTR